MQPSLLLRNILLIQLHYPTNSEISNYYSLRKLGSSLSLSEMLMAFRFALSFKLEDWKQNGEIQQTQFSTD